MDPHPHKILNPGGEAAASDGGAPDVSAAQFRPPRHLFPATSEWAYFNVAANAPLATPVRAAAQHHLDDLAASGSVRYRDWFEVVARARRRAAALLGCDPGEIAFLRNTSEGIAHVANGLRLGKGDSVVAVHGDFPANVHPWLRLREDGVDVRLVRPDEGGRLLPEQVLAACDETTRVAAASWVHFAHGFRLDVERLARLLHDRGVLFSLDAIQGLGALALDVRRAGVDFVAADGHKFLLTPEGIALFYVRRECLARLEPRTASWLSMKDPFDVTVYKGELQDDARRFEGGTPNTLGIHALDAALALLLETGVDAIERHVLALTDRLVEGLKVRRYAVASPRGEGERSAIVGFEKPGTDVQAIAARLLERKVVVATRAGCVRAAAHLYNDESDVDRLLEALP